MGETGSAEPTDLGSVLDVLTTPQDESSSRFVLEGWENAKSSDPDLNYLLAKTGYTWSQTRRLLQRFGHPVVIESLRRAVDLDKDIRVLWGICKNVEAQA